MENIHDRLTQARKKKFKKAADAVRAFGFVQSTYYAHENGRRGILVAEAERYAKDFGVSLYWLLTGRREEFTEDEQNLLRHFRSMDDDDKQRVTGLTERLSPFQHENEANG